MLKFNSTAPRVPASSAKVITSAAALQLLGPAKVWTTRFISAEEPDRNGVLSGDLYLVGHGAPSMTIERFWLLVDNLRARGVKEIKGNIIADRSHFDVAPHDPFAFDGEGNRPYNLGPDALMVNSRSFFIKIRPDKEAGVAYLYPEPRIAGVKLPESIPLSKEGCGAWRKQINPDFSNPLKPAFKGKFPLKCGPKDYFYTSLSADQYLQVVFADMWKKAGGTWKGKVVQGKLPEDSDDYKVLASSYSEPLTKLVYNMNKYSDNIIARQLFLALANTQKDEPKNLEGARAAVYEWAASLKIPASSLKIDNGADFLAPRSLHRRLRDSSETHVELPEMPEFVSSLPISGVDGTMRKRHVAQGNAHIKTGYIQNVRSIAGYVQTKSGERYAVAAIVNGPSAINSIPVMDAVICWVYGR